MNARLSALDRYALVSSSSPFTGKLGREANLFNCDLSYLAMRDALRERRGRLSWHLEFFREGKYHADGHRSAMVVMTPEEARGAGRLPALRKASHRRRAGRVAALADRPADFGRWGPSVFQPGALGEVLGEVLGVEQAARECAAPASN